jgi:hypothetical protein
LRSSHADRAPAGDEQDAEKYETGASSKLPRLAAATPSAGRRDRGAPLFTV